MSDSRFDHVYDPVATPNPAYDDDFEPSPAPANAPANPFARRNLAQAMLDRAHARQEAIADAFVDALLNGKLPFFRLLIELEQAALAGEAEAQDALRPGLAEILLPMLQRERAAASAASQPPPEPSPEPARHLPSLSAPAESAPPQPGITDIEAAEVAPCRSRTVTHNRRRAQTHAALPHRFGWKGSPETRRQICPVNQQAPSPARQRLRKNRSRPSVPCTLLTLTAVAAPATGAAMHPPLRVPTNLHRQVRRRRTHKKPPLGVAFAPIHTLSALDGSGS